MNKLKLSIIIPCYNCEKTLREAVDSCFVQGFSEDEIEVILVDDASTDTTRLVIKECVKVYCKIKVYLNDKNMGGGATRNIGIKKSSADVIFCLDSDDILPANTLVKMFKYLKDRNIDGVAFNFSIKFNNRDIRNIRYVDRFLYAGEPIPFESLLSNSGTSSPLDVVFMYTRDAFDKIKGYPTNHGFDTQGFAWRFLSAGLTAHTCPGATYMHRVNFHRSYYVRESDSGMVNYNWRSILLEHIDIFSEEVRDFIKSFDCSDFTRNLLSELKSKENILIPGYKNKLGRINYSNDVKFNDIMPIKRNSLRGIFMRIKSKIKYSLLNRKLYSMVRFFYKFIYRIFLKNKYFYFLSKNTNPISNIYGFDRGRPVDRYYIEKFLQLNSSNINGTCLELLNDAYIKKYGGNKVIKTIVLDIDKGNTKANQFGDLRDLKEILDETVDCIILTQVLQFIDNLDAAVSECFRILKPGGSLLATLPSVSRIDCVSGTEGDYWRFTKASAKYLFEKKFKPQNILVSSYGNSKIGMYFYAGMSQEDIPNSFYENNDNNFPLIITVKAVK